MPLFFKLLTVINFLLLINFTCGAQDENINAKQSLSKQGRFTDNFTYAVSYSDENKVAKNYLQLIDSIAHTTGISSHFARIYSKALENIATGTQGMDSATAEFIKKFENAFAESFLNACLDNVNGNLSPASEWKCFFSNPMARNWQLILLGVNVHVNMDFWQAMVNNFSEQEIRQHKKQLLACKSSIAKVYSQFFDTLIAENRYVRFINSFTKGLAKKLGEKLIYKWRRRNINLAVMFYDNHEKFKRRWVIIQKKKQKIDQVILRKRNVPIRVTE
jgi:hypothetical protein